MTIQLRNRREPGAIDGCWFPQPFESSVRRGVSRMAGPPQRLIVTTPIDHPPKVVSRWWDPAKAKIRAGRSVWPTLKRNPWTPPREGARRSSSEQYLEESRRDQEPLQGGDAVRHRTTSEVEKLCHRPSSFQHWDWNDLGLSAICPSTNFGVAAVAVVVKMVVQRDAGWTVIDFGRTMRLHCAEVAVVPSAAEDPKVAHVTPDEDHFHSAPSEEELSWVEEDFENSQSLKEIDLWNHCQSGVGEVVVAGEPVSLRRGQWLASIILS